MIGFGNPLLDGPDDRYAKLARLARDKQKCPNTVRLQIAGLLKSRDGVPALETQKGLANVAHIRSQAPLPETADELCAVARDVNADLEEMRLGARATEHEVKAMSASGQLAQYRIVHFATHGAMAGELKGLGQPGLLLTPPQAASEDDDGYLSAPEIASSQAGCRLGDPVRLEHGGWERCEGGTLVRAGPCFHLRTGTHAARLALGGRFSRHGETRHRGNRRNEPRCQHWPFRGAAPRHAVAYRQRRAA
jgi:hypothetical protein